jgi:hypothetical protein
MATMYMYFYTTQQITLQTTSRHPLSENLLVMSNNYKNCFVILISCWTLSIVRDVYLCDMHDVFVVGIHKNKDVISQPIPNMSSECFLSPEGGVGLVLKRGCLLTLAYYALPIWYEFGERRFNDILTGENRRTRKKTCPSATLSTANSTRIDPGHELGPPRWEAGD